MVSAALRVTETPLGTGTIRCDEYDVDEKDVDEFDGSEDGGEYHGNAKKDDEYLGRGERRRKSGLHRSDEQAKLCVSASVSNGLALCIDIILAASYLLSFLLPAISLTSYSSPRIVPPPAAVPVTLRAVLTMSQTLPSYSPCSTRYRPRRQHPH